MAVYFLRFENLIKIGYTEDVEFRCKALQAMSPVELKLVAVIEDVDSKFEKELHKRFKKFRSHGEWFFINDELRNLIENNRNYSISITPKYFNSKESRYNITEEERKRRKERMLDFHKKGIAGPNFSHLGVLARKNKR